MQDNTSHSRPLGHDPLTGARRTFHWDAATQSFSIETVYDQTAIVEENKLLHNASTDANWKGDTHRVASIPLAIWHDLKQRGILQDHAAFRNWLNDPANRFFRTRGGQV